MQKKKLMICAACIALLLCAAGYQTFAYFIKESTTTNEISTGYLKMSLEERIKANGVGWEMLPRENDPLSIMPGDIVQQEPYIKNVDAVDFYCRASYEISVVSKDGAPLSADVVSVTFDPTKWVQDPEEEGWYRYVDIVTAKGTDGDTTTPLFTEIHFSPEMDNSYIGCLITVIVDSQSVQSKHNEYDKANGETVLDVKGFSDIKPAKKIGGTK